MGTANFYNQNASKYFVIEDKTGEDEENDYEFIFDETIEMVKDLLDTSASENKRYFDSDKADIDRNRNFDSTSLGSYIDEFDYCNSNIKIKILPIIRCGYYSGANLDFEKEFVIDSDTYTELSEVLDHIREYGSNVFKLNLSNFEKKASELEKSMINEVEKQFEKITEPYVCIGRFSNGEALYEKFEDLSKKIEESAPSTNKNNDLSLN